jgi:hypothetical protein
MPDEIILSTPKRELHPAGSYGALCIDLIDLGMRVQTFKDRTSASQSCVLVFGTGEVDSAGREFFITREFNVSMGTKASLRKFLEIWRGRAFTPEEQESFALSQVVGKPAMLSIQHDPSSSGQVWANIASATPMPKGMQAPVVGRYERAPFWETRKQEYAKKYAEFVGSGVPKGDSSYHGPLEAELTGADEEAPF